MHFCCSFKGSCGEKHIILDIKDLKICRVFAFLFLILDNPFTQDRLSSALGQEHAEAGQVFEGVDHKHAEAEHKYDAQGV